MPMLIGKSQVKTKHADFKVCGNENFLSLTFAELRL